MSMLQRTLELFALYMAAGVLLLRDCPDDVSEKALSFLFLSLMRLLFCSWLSSVIIRSKAAE